MTQGNDLAEDSIELKVAILETEIKSINAKLAEILALFGRNGNSIPTRLNRIEGIMKVIIWLLSAIGAAVVIKVVNLNWGALLR